MSHELDAVLDRCVALLTQDPARTRDEVSALLNRWEEMGLISRQMRAVIVQRLRATSANPPNPAGAPPTTRGPDPASGDQNVS